MGFELGNPQSTGVHASQLNNCGAQNKVAMQCLEYIYRNTYNYQEIKP